MVADPLMLHDLVTLVNTVKDRNNVKLGPDNAGGAEESKIFKVVVELRHQICTKHIPL